MTDTTADIAALRDALPTHRSALHNEELVFSSVAAHDAYVAACHPERIARLLDALEAAQHQANARAAALCEAIAVSMECTARGRASAVGAQVARSCARMILGAN